MNNNNLEIIIKVKRNYERSTWFEDISLDLDDNSTVALDLQFSDISNPTVTKVPFSIQIKLPKSPSNNKVFNHIYNLDQVNTLFNPLIRIDFNLYIRGNLYQTGYLKLESVDEFYNIRLFGGLGDYFFKLANIKLKDIDLEEFAHKCDAKQVSNSLKGAALYNLNGRNIKDNFGYCVTYQGYYNDFDNNTILTYNKDTKQSEFMPVMWDYENKTYRKLDLNEHHRTRKDNETDITSKRFDNYFGELRCQYQRPRIRLRWLILKVMEMMRGEGWNTILDQTFFNDYNPYWTRLWCILKQYNQEDLFKINALMNEIIYDSNLNITGNVKYNYKNLPEGSKNGFQGANLDGEIIWDINLDSSRWTDKENLVVDINIPFRTLVVMPKDEPKPKNKPMTKPYGTGEGFDADWTMGLSAVLRYTNIGTGKKIELQMKDTDNLSSGKISFNNLNSNNNQISSMRPNNDLYNDRTQLYTSNKRDSTVFGFTVNGHIPSSELNSNPDLNKFEIVFKVTGTTYWRRTTHSWFTKYGARVDILKDYNIVLGELNSNIRNNAKLINKENIIQSDKTAFDLLTNYCKLFGLLFVKDSIKKEVTIKTRGSFYFDNYKMVDWSDKMDRGENHKIVPVPFDYRYGVFAYNEKDTKYEIDYKGKTDIPYGALKFDNGTHFSDKEKVYIDKMMFDNGVVATDRSQYYYGRGNNTTYKDSKSLFHFVDSSGEGVDNDFVLAFFDNYIHLSSYPMIVTEDDPRMFTEGTCWTDLISLGTKIMTIPKMTKNINYQGNYYSLNFGRPFVNYSDTEPITNSDDPYAGNETLYRRFWQNFIRGRFDINNRTLVARFNLNEADIRGVFSKFIKIDETEWVVNKINKWHPGVNELTEVELIKVKDKENFKTLEITSEDFDIYFKELDRIVYSVQKDKTNSTYTMKPTSGDTKVTLEVKSEVPFTVEGAGYNQKCEGDYKLYTFIIRDTSTLWQTINFKYGEDEKAVNILVFNSNSLIDWNFNL